MVFDDRSSKRCSLQIHDLNFSQKDLVVNPDVFAVKVGSYLSISEPGAPKENQLVLRVDDISPVKGGRLQISLLRTVAEAFRLQPYQDVIVRGVNPTHAVADFVEVFVKDQFAARADLWRFKQAIIGLQSPVFVGRSFNVNGLRARVLSLNRAGKPVASAVLADTTKFNFRSRSSRFFWLVQVSVEMFEFAPSGHLYYEVLINNFINTLVKKWEELSVTHSVTVVFFARTYFIHKVPEDVAEAVSKGLDGRALRQDVDGTYEDTYKVVIENKVLTEVDDLIISLKKEMLSFPRAMGWCKRESFGDGSSPNVGRPSTAQRGNFLEAINVTLNVLEKHYLDRDLSRSGNSIVTMSAGPGVFSVDSRMAAITLQRMMDNGIGMDMVSLSQPPLHTAPLFIYKDKNKPVYEVPHWMNLSFVTSPDTSSENLEPMGPSPSPNLTEKAEGRAERTEERLPIPRLMHLPLFPPALAEGADLFTLLPPALAVLLGAEKTGAAQDETSEGSSEAAAAVASAQTEDSHASFGRGRLQLWGANGFSCGTPKPSRSIGSTIYALHSEQHLSGTSSVSSPSSNKLARTRSPGSLDGLPRRPFPYLDDQVGPPTQPSLAHLGDETGTQSTELLEGDGSGSQGDSGVERLLREFSKIDANVFTPGGKGQEKWGAAGPRRFLVGSPEEGQVGSAGCSRRRRARERQQSGDDAGDPPLEGRVGATRLREQPLAKGGAPRGGGGSARKASWRVTTPLSIDPRDVLGAALGHGGKGSRSTGRGMATAPMPIRETGRRRGEHVGAAYSLGSQSPEPNEAVLGPSKLRRRPSLPKVGRARGDEAAVELGDDLNPFRQRDEKAILKRRTPNRRRWSHVFPPGEQEFKHMPGPIWKSLCQPAILPLTTDYLPEEFRKQGNVLKRGEEYEESNYNLTMPDHGDAMAKYYTTDFQVLTELMCQRLAQDFQLVQEDSRANGLSTVLSGGRGEGRGDIFLSMGHRVHCLSYDVQSRSVEVFRYIKAGAKESPFTCYQYRLWLHQESRFQNVQQLFYEYPHPELKWNALDELICGIGKGDTNTGEKAGNDLAEGARNRRLSFVLIPPALDGRESEDAYRAKLVKLADYLTSKREEGSGGEVKFDLPEQDEDQAEDQVEAEAGKVVTIKVNLKEAKSGSSGQYEWLHVVCDAHKPLDRVIHLDIHWLVCSGSSVAEFVSGLSRRANQIGLKLVQVPQYTRARHIDVHAFVTHPFIPVSSDAAMAAVEAELVAPGNEADFVHDADVYTDWASFFVSSSIGIAPNRHTYCHRSGVAFLRVAPKGFVFLENWHQLSDFTPSQQRLLADEALQNLMKLCMNIGAAQEEGALLE